MKQSLFIDLHAIQTVPPSCVNRDDIGSPKTAVYGGVERARVSSQAWKHAMREYFKTIFAGDELGSRTKQAHKLLASKIQEMNPSLSEDAAKKLARDVLDEAITKKDKKDKKDGGKVKFEEEKDRYSTLFFISRPQIRALAELALADKMEKKKYKAALKQALSERPSLDIALFGRMVADDPSLNYDAAAQVAHAISTHEVQTEYDYFTAVDDEQKEDESDAGHLGTVAFNSSTFYRYATVNVTELAAALGGDTARVVRGFAEAFACSMPTGKQNTFANRTLPDLLYVTVRRDQPVNLSGAFEKAIPNTQNGYVKASCEALLAYAEKMYSSFADKPELALGCGEEALLACHAEVMSIKALLDRVQACAASEDKV